MKKCDQYKNIEISSFDSFPRIKESLVSHVS